MNDQQRTAVEQLGALIADYHVEASRWPDMKGMLIRQQADAIDGIRINTVLDNLTPDEAFAWLDIGRRILAEHIMRRCVSDHPARRVIREQLGLDE